ncbi:4-hydroxy-tetrahydrodipicolinate synthase [Lewinella sp. LCG006]|uniref:4-hydroxy-tetrahydrodipicolinate synthase n=1 Tax=Lewinella sp. LCG006 TaxID=3231911 RepID=UPI00345F9185
MDQNFWDGVYTAIVTPFHKQEEVDYEGFRKLIREQIAAGVKGIVVVGTTGESPTLNITEHLQVVETAVEEVAGRIQVIAGTGSNDTRSALNTTARAHELGVDGFLQVGPYYNKPSQEGLYQHFSSIADSTDKPIMLYSIPGRSGIAIDTSTVARLRARFEHVNCIKEAGGSCDKVSELVHELGDSITVLSGDDALTLPFMSVGAKGVVSVTSNLLPSGMVKMVQAALANDFVSAQAYHKKFFPLFAQMLSLEPNPVCIKYALQKAGKIETSQVRLPLVAPALEHQAKLDLLLQDFLS